MLSILVSDNFINPLLDRIIDNGIVGFRLFTFVEYSLITYFFYNNIKSERFRKIIFYTSISFLAYSLFDLTNSNLNSFDSVPSGISAILILIFCVYALFERINQSDNLFIYTEQSFWLIVSLFLYFSGTFFIFLFAQANMNDNQYESTFKMLNNGFSILRNFILVIAFFYWRKRKG